MKCDAHPEINDKLMINWKIICVFCSFDCDISVLGLFYEIYKSFNAIVLIVVVCLVYLFYINLYRRTKKFLLESKHKNRSIEDST